MSVADMSANKLRDHNAQHSGHTNTNTNANANTNINMKGPISGADMCCLAEEGPQCTASAGVRIKIQIQIQIQGSNMRCRYVLPCW